MFATHLRNPLNLPQYSVTISKRESEDPHLDSSTVRLENYVQVRMWSSWMTRQGFWTLWYELEPTERLSSMEQHKHFCVPDRRPSGSGNIHQKGASLDAAARGPGEEMVKPWLTVDTVPEGYFHIPCLPETVFGRQKSGRAHLMTQLQKDVAGVFVLGKSWGQPSYARLLQKGRELGISSEGADYETPQCSLAANVCNVYKACLSWLLRMWTDSCTRPSKRRALLCMDRPAATLKSLICSSESRDKHALSTCVHPPWGDRESIMSHSASQLSRNAEIHMQGATFWKTTEMQYFYEMFIRLELRDMMFWPII